MSTQVGKQMLPLIRLILENCKLSRNMPVRSKLMIRFLLFSIKQRTRSFITFIKEIRILYQIFVVQHLYWYFSETQVNTRSCYRELEASVSLAPFCPVKEVSSNSLGAAPVTHVVSLTFWQRDGDVHLERQGQVRIKVCFTSTNRDIDSNDSIRTWIVRHHEWILWKLPLVPINVIQTPKYQIYSNIYQIQDMFRARRWVNIVKKCKLSCWPAAKSTVNSTVYRLD